jgi:predicted metal-dependent hydrolase
LARRRPSEAERREQEQVLQRLRRDARILAPRFGLELRDLAAERANVTRRYGVCYEDGTIRIRLRHVRTGRLLKYSSLVDTLCHELAHLRHFNHGARFQLLYRSILSHARRIGIYRPRRPITAARPAEAAANWWRPVLPTPARAVAAERRLPVRRPRPAPQQLELF